MKIKTMGIRSFFMAAVLTFLSGLNPLLAESDDALFQLDDKDYRVADLPPLLKQALYDAELKFYKEKAAIVDEALAVMEIDKRAQESGKSSEEMAAELFAAEQPSDEAVNAFYEENKARINQPLDAIKPQIIQLLVQQTQAQKQQAFLTEIKENSVFQLLLKKPLAPLTEIDINGFPFKGGAEAKAVLVEFADYQCPHCKRAGDVLKEVSAEFGDELKVVFMDYPINRSGISRKIAEGAACAAQQDKFWEYHDLAFSDQRALKKDSAPGFAEKLGLDQEAFAKCLDSDYPATQVKKGEEQGKRLGVNSTPTLFLNGRKLHLHDLEADLPAEIKKALSAAK
ncbi:MAG: DsbA family protein [Thiolinea sp.]